MNDVQTCPVSLMWIYLMHSSTGMTSQSEAVLTSSLSHEQTSLKLFKIVLTDRLHSQQMTIVAPSFLLFLRTTPSPHQPTELTQASFVAPRMAWKETNNENRHSKSSESNQNHRNNVNSDESLSVMEMRSTSMPFKQPISSIISHESFPLKSRIKPSSQFPVQNVIPVNQSKKRTL